MFDFLKEWRGIILMTVVLLVVTACIAVILRAVAPSIQAKRAVCYNSAQRFTPPLEWRWNPWGWGDGCELFINGAWFPADMVEPALK